MIVSRAPLRISFAGGGSDLPAFYSRHEGAVLSVTIDSYVYVTVHPHPNPEIIELKHKITETVTSPEELSHRLVSMGLAHLGIESGLYITTQGDVPSGTGLGSSGAFTVSLMNALYTYAACSPPEASDLAEMACHVEMVMAAEPVGKQDQYASAFGGLNLYEFHQNGSVGVSTVECSKEFMRLLERSLMLFYLGPRRSTRAILSEESRKLKSGGDTFSDVKHLVTLAHDMAHSITDSDLSTFAALMHEGWMIKRSLSSRISSERIDGYYEIALASGAMGGRLVGAGGGGFLLLVVPPERRDSVRKALCDLREFTFSFESHGAAILLDDGRRTGGFIQGI